jgi:hypothetical protein
MILGTREHSPGSIIQSLPDSSTTAEGSLSKPQDEGTSKLFLNVEITASTGKTETPLGATWILGDYRLWYSYLHTPQGKQFWYKVRIDRPQFL